MIALLQFDWKPQELRLLLAASADSGPARPADWAVRSGVPANHFAAVLAELVRLGGVKHEARAEGVCLFVQPVQFWRVTEKCSAARWHEAWTVHGQARLGLATEEKSLAEALQEAPRGPALPESGRGDTRNPGVHVPESGSRPTHGPEHGRRHGPVHALNMLHGKEESRNPGAARLRTLAGDKSRAMELAVEHLFPGLEERFRKHWTRRVAEDPGLVEYAIEEALLTRRGERPGKTAAYANRVYLAHVETRGRLKA